MIRRLFKSLFILLLIVGCYEPAIQGCTDSAACNYESTATKDNNTCISPQGCNEWCQGDTLSAQELDCADVCGGTNICGCNDTTALNYDLTATFNDGSCEFDTTSPTVVITYPANNKYT